MGTLLMMLSNVLPLQSSAAMSAVPVPMSVSGTATGWKEEGQSVRSLNFSQIIGIFQCKRFR